MKTDIIQHFVLLPEIGPISDINSVRLRQPQFLYVSQMLWSGRGHQRHRLLKHNMASVTY